MSNGAVPLLSTVPPSYRDRLVAFFHEHDETKLGYVDDMLEKYAGKEEKLIAALLKKYKSRLPQPECAVAPAVDLPAGDLQDECHPSSDGKSAYRDAAVAILQKYDPSRLVHVDYLLCKYEGKEELLVRQLKKKYAKGGIQPAHDDRSPLASTTPVERVDYHQRLTSFFLRYDPEKVPHVEMILRKYSGKEAKLIKALVRRFGPEPSVIEGCSADQEGEKPCLASTEDTAVAPGDSVKDTRNNLSGSEGLAVARAEGSQRTVDVSSFIRLFSVEWCLTEEQQAENSRRLDAFFHSHPARPSSQPAPLLPSVQTCGETVDPDIWSLPEVSQEELQRWREEKLSLSDRLVWRRRKPIKQVNMQRM
ncbi:hypothetical protein C3747_98g136 [Trypanosoma cruzi]|uniref:Uncharacterized protein n=2 Tax=Trypanosoma cruzi TaxID=5693 RepID=Q4CRE9_TRYCC|nr:uncharacterized protein Tc00.1047053504933.20 [Trypanosoma cruzi]EAN82851.1 hypothetical protein Tc00.1047053504933.20 [Trypanosoma cruzi]PWV07732.1 hypothetical protein C3747_98g136 [Trypanosoma cruzi]|eukprot:XP_804702.1 hypothetical protein Tc00.1047053504933.20 [Trypanosoma cruzi strain CL Brener]